MSSSTLSWVDWFLSSYLPFLVFARAMKDRKEAAKREDNACSFQPVLRGGLGRGVQSPLLIQVLLCMPVLRMEKDERRVAGKVLTIDETFLSDSPILFLLTLGPTC